MTLPTRRTFLTTLAGGAAALALPGPAARAFGRRDTPVRRILILGGTGFLGPHVVQAAVHRGHDVTLFNRGRTNTDLFPDLKKIQGNRDPRVNEGLRGLRESPDRWDAIIDLSGFVPRHVRASTELLKDRASQYVFISSVNAYRDWPGKTGLDESAVLARLDDPTIERVTDETLGPLKAACERQVTRIASDQATIIRPGSIVGPFDPHDHLTYWARRIASGGTVLAPGDRDDPVQYIDARDLAWWTIDLVEQQQRGVYNAVGPDATLTMAGLLHGCRAVTGGDATFTWIDAEFLSTRGVTGYRGVPLWTDPDGPMAGLNQVSNQAAIKAGLRFRPLAQTVRDTLDWFSTLPRSRQVRMKAGLSPEREQALLKAWADRRR